MNNWILESELASIRDPIFAISNWRRLLQIGYPTGSPEVPGPGELCKGPLGPFTWHHHGGLWKNAGIFQQKDHDFMRNFCKKIRIY